MDDTNHYLLLDAASSAPLQDFKCLIKTIKYSQVQYIKNSERQNCLHVSCLHNSKHPDVAIYLKDYIFNLCDTDRRRVTALMYACQNGLYDFVTTTLQEANKSMQMNLLYNTDDEHCHMLFYCVRDNGLNNNNDNIGKTKLKVFQFLLEFSKELFSQTNFEEWINQGANCYRGTVLDKAIEQKKTNFIKILQKYNAKTKQNLKYIPWLIVNTESPSEEFMQDIASGLTNEEKVECLFIVIKNHRIENREESKAYKMKWAGTLLENLNEPLINTCCPTEKKTLLQHAYDRSLKSLASQIKSQGGKASILIGKKQLWCGLLHYHIQWEKLKHRKFPDLTEFITEYGEVDINQSDSMGKTALHYAAESFNFPDSSTSTNSQIKFAKDLLDHGAEIDVQDNLGCTALYNALNNKHVDLTSFLLQQGADPKIKTLYGLTPLNIGLDQIENMMQIQLSAEASESLYSVCARNINKLKILMQSWKLPRVVLTGEFRNLDTCVDNLVRFSEDPDMYRVAQTHEDILNRFYQEIKEHLDFDFAIRNLQYSEYVCIPVLSDAEAKTIKESKDPMYTLIHHIPKLSPLALAIFALNAKHGPQPYPPASSEFTNRFVEEVERYDVNMGRLQEAVERKHRDILEMFREDIARYVDYESSIETLQCTEYHSDPVLNEEAAKEIVESANPMNTLLENIPKLSPLALPIFALNLNQQGQMDRTVEPVPEDFINRFLMELKKQHVQLKKLEQNRLTRHPGRVAIIPNY